MPYSPSKKHSHIYAIGTVAALAGFLFGFDTGIISGAQDYIFKTFNIPEATDKAIAALKGFVVASVPLGALLGAIVSGWFAEKLGRRNSLLFTSLLFAFGALLTALAGAIDHVIWGRLVMGVAIGISAMVTPMYLSEISPPTIRGTIVTFFQLAITMGLMAAFMANYVCADLILDHTLNWRWMFGLGALPAVALMLGMIPMPESPRWLFAKGKAAKARETLRYLYATAHIENEANEIQESLRRPEGSWKDCFTSKIFPLLLMAFGLFVLQQLSGINAIMYYGPSVFESAGFGDSGKLLAQVAIGVVNVSMTVLSLWLIDRLGRRPLLFWGFAGMCVCLVAVGFCLQSAATSAFGPWVSLASTLAFIGFFAVSLGPVPYLIMSEVFPLKVRSSGMAIASCANWGFNMLVTESFPILQQGIGMTPTFYFFAFWTAIGFLFTWRFVPETKNKRLESIEANLYAGQALRNLGNDYNAPLTADELEEAEAALAEAR
jgi:sugar porter (SP) family MFS transporter